MPPARPPCQAWTSDKTRYVTHGVTAGTPDGHDAPMLCAAATVVRYTLNGRILLANLLPSSRSTFSWGSFLSFFAFKEGT
jgi:hypothetical protein